ncbi:MAG: zf-TFIIB domain-containing protein [Pseudomonadales bacterium]
MDCPKCNKAFERITFQNIEVDRCTGCFGLWFDTLAKEDLVKMAGAESIDIGVEQVDQHYNEMRDIDCPVCRQAMIPMVDKDQFHIKFEACASCYGLFFDAGEFTDLKDYTVVERFQKMLTTLRDNL